METRKLDEAMAAYEGARARKEEISRVLHAARSTEAAERKAAGRIVADGGDASAASARVVAARVQVEINEAALEEIGARIRALREAVRKCEIQAGLAEIDELVAAAEVCRRESLVAAEILGRSHAKWNALARRAERVAIGIGRPSQPIPYEGVRGALSQDHDDGLGLAGCLARHGILANFVGCVRERLPVIEPKTNFSAFEEEDEDDEDEPGVEISVENVPLSEADAYTRRH